MRGCAWPRTVVQRAPRHGFLSPIADAWPGRTTYSVAELFTAVSGLGGAIITYGNAFKTDKLFVIIILLALLGLFLTESVRHLERWLAPWKETERAS